MVKVKTIKNGKNKASKDAKQGRKGGSKKTPNYGGSFVPPAKVFRIPREPNTAVASVSKISMTECTLKYAKAVSDPFSAEARGACVPVGNGSTMKTTNFLRLDGIGSAAGALVYICPTVAGDCPYAFYTTTLWTGTTATPFLTPGSQTALATLNPGWAYATLPSSFNASACLGTTNSYSTGGIAANEVNGKVVSAGARVYYTGTELNLGGTIYCYHDPAHASVNYLNGTNIGALADCVVESVMRDPCTLSLYAVNQSELNFQTVQTAGLNNIMASLYPYSSISASWYSGASNTSTVDCYSPVLTSMGLTNNPRIGIPTGVIYVTSQAAAGNFHLDLISHNEYIGVGASPMLTPNGSDIEGVMKVQAAAQMVPALKNTSNNPHKSPWDFMKRALSEVWTMAKPLVVPLATRLIGL